MDRYEAAQSPVRAVRLCDQLDGLLAKEKKLWNPVVKKVMSWIDVKQLNRQYGPSGCTMSCSTCLYASSLVFQQSPLSRCFNWD
jgi:hypothetical protein